jgi:hypothetical protein
MPSVKEGAPVERPVSFNKIYATNVLVGMTEHDIRVEFFNERILEKFDEDEEKWVYISEAMTILTPLAAKRLRSALTKKINEYEKKYGKIKEDAKVPLLYTSVSEMK